MKYIYFTHELEVSKPKSSIGLESAYFFILNSCQYNFNLV